MRSEFLLGVKWSAASHAVRQGTLCLATLILARLLSPSDFGLLSMAMVVVSLFNLFNDLGTSAAIIQSKVQSERFLSSLFWFNAGLGVLLAGVLYMIAPAVAAIYHEPRVIPILRCLSLGFIFTGCGMPLEAVLARRLMFPTLSKIEMTASLLGAVTGTAAALAGMPRWGLVCQSLTTTATTTACLWLFSPWRPSRSFDWAEVKSVGSYSLNLVGFNLSTYLVRNADSFLVGRYLGPQALGYYGLAYRLVVYPLYGISSTIGKISFPVFSQMQDDDRGLQRAYLRSVQATAFIAFPLVLGLMASSRVFVFSMFGPAWEPTVLPLTIFSSIGMLLAIGGLNGAVYRAKARTGLQFRVGITSSVPILAGFIIGLRWGIAGVAAGYAAAVCLLAFPSFKICAGLIGLRPADLALAVWRPCVCGLLMLVALCGVRLGLPDSDASSLAVLVLSGVFFYTTTSWLMNRGPLQASAEVAGIKKGGLEFARFLASP